MIKRRASLGTMVRRVFSAFIFIFLVAVLAIGWAEGRDFSWALKDEIEARLTHYTERPVTVEGRIGFKLNWNDVRIFAEDIATDGGDDSATMNASIHAERAGVTVGLWPLLQGRIELRGLLLREARIMLPAPGEPSPQAEGASTGENTEAVLAMLNNLHQVSIDNLHLIRGRRDGDPQEIDIDHLTVAPENGGLHAAFVGGVEGTPYDLDAHITSLQSLLRLRGSPATLTASIGQNSIQATGTLTRIWPFEADLNITGTAPDVARLAELSGISLPGAGAGNLAGNFSVEPRRAVLTLTNFTIHHRTGTDGAEPNLGVGPVTGTITVTHRDDDRFEITGTLTAEHIDAEPLFRRGGEEEPRPSVAEAVELPLELGLLFADRPIPYEHFDRIAGRLELHVAMFHYKDAVFESVVLPFTADEGVLAIDGATGTYGEAPLSLAISADAGTRTVRIQASAHEFDLGKLTDELGGEAMVRGPAHIAVQGTGAGANVGEVLGTFTGQSNLMVGEGELERGGIDFLAADLLQAFFTDAGRQTTRLTCLINRIDFDDGVGESRAFLLDTNLITITGRGQVNFKENNVDFHLAPRPKDPTLLSLAADYTVEGPILNPTISPDVGDLIRGVATTIGSLVLTGGAAALLPLLGGDAEMANPCIAALTGETPSADEATAE